MRNNINKRQCLNFSKNEGNSEVGVGFENIIKSSPLPNMNYVNIIEEIEGNARAVCQCCGLKSTPVKTDEFGEPNSLYLDVNWSEAPFPFNFIHNDGSRGTLYCCPDCNNKLKNGERLKIRNYET